MKYLIWLLTTLVFNSVHSQNASSKDIINRSIAFHDPHNHWQTFKATLSLVEERESGDRNTQFSIDNTLRKFIFERDSISHGMLLDSCFNLAGETSCDRIQTIRNYYLYLWGLPMKLKDPNTPVLEDIQELSDWNGHHVYGVRVNYERENWTFFFEQSTYELVGYQFYFNYKEGGEVITLKDLVEFEGIKIPKTRTWHTLPDRQYLVTDKLEWIK